MIFQTDSKGVFIQVVTAKLSYANMENNWPGVKPSFINPGISRKFFNTLTQFIIESVKANCLQIARTQTTLTPNDFYYIACEQES